MGSNEVWPPPIDKETTGQSVAPPKCSRAATLLGVLSLVVTLPSLLVVAISYVNVFFVHSSLWHTFVVQAPQIVMMLHCVPVTGLVLGVCGWRSQRGKLSVACSIVYYGLFFYGVFILGWGNDIQFVR